MSYLIDSTWVIDALRGTQEARELFARLTDEALAISLITYGEVYEGIYYGRSQRVSDDAFHRFLHGVTILPLNRSIMRQFALIRGGLRNRGEIIGDPDILIGATALHHTLTMVTQNRRHFQRIPGLQLHQ